MATELTDRPVVSAGRLSGMGIDGLVGGVLFHQILRVHNTAPARRPKAGVGTV